MTARAKWFTGCIKSRRRNTDFMKPFVLAGVLDFLLIFFSELGDKTFFIVAKEEVEAALAEELHREENFGRKLQDEQENERQLAAKEASLHQEPTAGNENAVTLLVRMPDGSRRGRRFLKTDNLQGISINTRTHPKPGEDPFDRVQTRLVTHLTQCIPFPYGLSLWRVRADYVIYFAK
ncbi:hypothetical protein ACS0TY_004396 [Phlomoides rotata]